MKTLIAGFGSIGRRHFRNLLALGETDILFYRTGRSELPPIKLEELAGYVVEHDLDAALGHQPDAVIVANPTAVHLDVAIPAAQAGAHMLLEKPVAHSLERVDELQAAVTASGSRVLVGFQFRYHPTLQAAAQLLGSGELGAALHARATWGEYLPDWHPWEQDFRQGYSARADLGGGVVFTLTHPIDYLRWLLGEVTEVQARLGNTGALGLDVEEQADIIIGLANGAQANLHLDYLQRPPIHELELVCAEGRLTWRAADGLLRVYRAATETWEDQRPPEGFERNDLFLAQTRHFLEVVRDGLEPRCRLDDGVQTLKIALAAHEAHARGQRIALKE